MQDQIRWVPTDHMLADAFTKSMPPDLLLKYLKDGVYSFKYDDQIKNTKREQAKERSEKRKTAQMEKSTTGVPSKVGLKVNCCYWANVLDFLGNPGANSNQFCLD